MFVLSNTEMKLIILTWYYGWIMDGGIMADFVREDEDEYFWTNQDPQPFEPEYAEKDYMFWKLSRQEERLRQSNSLGPRGESAWIGGIDVGLVNLCRQKMSASAVLSWT